MILLIDNTIEGQGSSPREIRSALQQIEPDLRMVTEPFRNITPELVKTLSPSHIILSGQSHPWDRYSAESLAGVFHVIRSAPKPILGVCGGQQQMALAFGAPVDLIERIAAGEGYEGAYRERGFCTVNLDSQTDGGIFSGCDEVKSLPADFICTATNQVSDIQAMQHTSLPLFGVQFHPELFDQEHPDGRIILENFLKL